MPHLITMVIYGDIIGISWGYSWIMIERERERGRERERDQGIKVSRWVKTLLPRCMSKWFLVSVLSGR